MTDTHTSTNTAPASPVGGDSDSDGKNKRSLSDFPGLIAAAGSWQGEDTDAMIAAIYADRARSMPRRTGEEEQR